MHRYAFLWTRGMERRGPKTDFFSMLAPFDAKMSPSYKMCDKTTGFCTSHIDAQHRLVTSIDAPQPHDPQIACGMVPSTQELYGDEKMPVAGKGSKKTTETVFFRVAQAWQTASCRDVRTLPYLFVFLLSQATL